ncbi:hypothetical protein HPB51_013039 [Rhipicephalus microplus]|uniref:BBS7 beta-propeller domain-containing protein n=1 Tax=Rhipicephalus microplus TaxID=6941 RepID=A0A9J6F3U1_RHIMP|nr:hypothetical protein HPB51_013039 [Rhipicephalus microplus]
MNRIEKASRVPKLPVGGYKIVIRPRGGLRVAALGPTDITRDIHEAAATPPEVRNLDVICPNKTQNIMIVSTPDPDSADQCRNIKKILTRCKEYEEAAYETAPDDTVKGIIKRISLEEIPGSIRAALVTERNHSIITTERLVEGTLPGAVKILPRSSEGSQKVVVGSQSGVVHAFGASRGRIEVSQLLFSWEVLFIIRIVQLQTVFKTLPAGKGVGCVQLGGPVGSIQDKIFVAAGNEITGYTRKGKQFLKFDTNLTDNIRCM